MRAHKIILQKNHHPSPLLDKIIYFIAIGGPLLTIPQAYEIFTKKTAAGVSLLTWVMYGIVDIFLIAYTFRHKIKPLLITYFAYLLIDIIIVTGIIIYKK